MLRLFTASYPYGFGESFLNNELPALSDEFGEVVVYPLIPKGEIQKSFDPQHQVVNHQLDGLTLSFKDKLFCLRILFIEIVNSGKGKFVLKNAKRFLSELKKGVVLAKWVNNQKMSEEDAFYSFWMNDWALALAMLKKRNSWPNFVMRINGFDIYNERHEGNYLPFRYFIYTQLTKLYTPSPTSANYVRELKKFPEKASHSFFGTQDYGQCTERLNEEYVIFSCSSAIPLKRLDKIAEVVCKLKFPVTWVHHGEGETIELVEAVLKNAPNNVSFKLSRKVDDYEQVLNMQKELAPDLFINLSTTEGLPVTFLEAMSFGVPILANDVGSCKDVITTLTGVLVSADADPQSIANEITDLHRQKKRIKDGPAIRAYWKENFFAPTNYARFAQELKKQLKHK